MMSTEEDPGVYIRGEGGGSIVWVCPAENYEGAEESMQPEETENLYTCARTKQCQCGGGSLHANGLLRQCTYETICARAPSLPRSYTCARRKEEGRKEGGKGGEHHNHACLGPPAPRRRERGHLEEVLAESDLEDLM